MANGHGGPRQGQPGVAYPQRTDLNMARAQQPGAVGQQAAPQQPGRSFVGPDDTPMIGDPSGDKRPLTDGLPMGPGAGPSALMEGPRLANDKTLLALEVLYSETGSDYIRRLIQRYHARRRGKM